MKTPPPPLTRSDIVLMAHTICDADSSLEDMKHGYRCAAVGCLAVRDTCIAYRQAKAAAKKLTEAWALAAPVESSRADNPSPFPEPESEPREAA